MSSKKRRRDNRYIRELCQVLRNQDSVEKLYSEGSKGKKTAIVTETGVQHSLATLYSDIGKDLPREIRIFSNLKSAKDWIKQ